MCDLEYYSVSPSIDFKKLLRLNLFTYEEIVFEIYFLLISTKFKNNTYLFCESSISKDLKTIY